MANVNPADDQGSRPIPDPTVLTTEALTLAIVRAKELLSSQIGDNKELSELHDRALREAIEKELLRLEDVQNQKFAGVDKQFSERDIRTNQADVARDSALQAALQAAKELVGAQGEATKEAAAKTETSFTKQIDQIGSLISNANTATNARIDELKERLDRGDGSHSGVDAARTLSNRTVSTIIAAMSVAVAVIGTIIVLATVLTGK